jgi:FkbM family methyltransferase
MANSCGWDELNFLDYAKEHIKNPNPVLLDCGFNLGDFTEIWLQKFGNSACSIGFEPITEIYDLSVKRFKDFDNVIINNVGLHNEIIHRKKFYYLQNGMSGCSGIYNRPVYEKFVVKEIEVELITLDCIRDTLPRIDYFKCDTEGDELFVFQGADKFLDETPPRFIQFEYGGCQIESHTTGKQIVEFLNNKGYDVFDKNLKLTTPSTFLENYDLTNYLAAYKN